MVRQKYISLESISRRIVFKLQWTIRMKHTKRRIDEWVYWAYSLHLSSCCFMLHSPLDNEYLTMKYFPQSHQLLIGFLISSSNLTSVNRKVYFVLSLISAHHGCCSSVARGLITHSSQSWRIHSKVRGRYPQNLSKVNWEFILLFRNETPPVYIDRFCV